MMILRYAQVNGIPSLVHWQRIVLHVNWEGLENEFMLMQNVDLMEVVVVWWCVTDAFEDAFKLYTQKI